MNNIQQKVLDESICKTQNLITTSLKFKEDFINYFQNHNEKNIVEVGCAYGYSTMILSTLFKNVFTINDNFPNEQGDNTIFIENKISNKDYYDKIDVDIKSDTEHDFSNITYIRQDSYGERGWADIIQNIDVSFVDCVHTYSAVESDIENSLNLGVGTIVFDDYGLFPDVKKCVDDYIEYGVLKVEEYIGLEKGVYDFQNGQQREFLDYEGVICSVV
jgi:hypothetical protein|tara:strand:- start:41 stop:691 length:651 start_codon:yes stop_codon:yes gene_type:complete